MFLVLGLVWLADAELGCGERQVARAALSRAREIADEEPVPPFVADRLQAGELSILRILPGPATQREIGAALFLSVNTVKAYNKSLYRKLVVSSRQEAVAAARELGLI